ncbi:MAG: hypothetical protein WD737_05285 [Gemmatimonadota bacterium]
MHRAIGQALVLLAVLGSAGGVMARAAAAQVPAEISAGEELWELRLADGSTLYGRVQSVSGDALVVTTAGGATVELQRSMIRSMAPVSGVVRDGEVWPTDPNLTRLFFGPTGRNLERGEGYVGVFELFFPFVTYAPTDFLTLAGGTPVIPEVIGRVFYFAPKVGGRISEKATVGAGVLAFHDASADAGDVSSVGVVYGVGTYGTEDTAGTFGLGWGFAGDEVENRPVALVGLERRLSPRMKLLSENYFISYRDGSGPGARTEFASLLSGGIRFFGQRLSADAGLGIAVAEGDSFCCLPLVNFVYNFGVGR